MAVIKYDRNGKRVNPLPTSPRHIPEGLAVGLPIPNGTEIQARRVNAFTAAIIARNVRSSFTPTEDAAALRSSVDTLAVARDRQAQSATIQKGKLVLSHDSRTARSASAFANDISQGKRVARQHIANGREKAMYRAAGKGSADDRWAINIVAVRSDVPSLSPMALPAEVRRVRAATVPAVERRDFDGEKTTDPAVARRADAMRKQVRISEESQTFLGVALRDTRPQYRNGEVEATPRGEKLPRLAGRPD
jgi:hypothetical protein